MTRVTIALALALSACGGEEPKSTANTAAKPAAPASGGEYQAKQDPIVGDAVPSLLLSQAWFMKDANGKSKPGPARLEIWRNGPAGWNFTRLEDPESNVFHKSILSKDGSILTIGAMGAHLKRWSFANGSWSQEKLWSQSWGGKFDRLRDIEVGDVDGDGLDEYVIATHDFGVVAVFNPGVDGGEAEIIEMDKKPTPLSTRSRLATSMATESLSSSPRPQTATRPT
jgi:hypothetical protein